MKNSKKYQISKDFQQAIRTFCKDMKLHDYQFAVNQNISPTRLSFIVTGRVLYPLDDPMIKKIAKAIDFKKSCFQVEDQGREPERLAATM